VIGDLHNFLGYRPCEAKGEGDYRENTVRMYRKFARPRMTSPESVDPRRAFPVSCFPHIAIDMGNVPL
jgi:hypothetical protein